LVLVAVIFAFLGLVRLRSLAWFTYDTWQMYLAYLSSYIGSSVLSGMANFVEIGLVTLQPLPNQWQNLSGVPLLSYQSFATVWYLLSTIEIIIAVISFAALYSIIVRKRSYLAKIGSFTLIVAGILDVSSPYPLIESILGVIALFVLFRPDVKEAFGARIMTPGGRQAGQPEEVTFKADLDATSEKRKTGIRCPNCGLLLPPSAKVCRRCKAKIRQ
jgi:ribosomal protein L40E